MKAPRDADRIERLVGEMFTAIDPARDVSDTVLAQLSPEEEFWQRWEIERAVDSNPQSLNVRFMTTRRWWGGAAASLVAVVLSVTVAALNTHSASRATHPGTSTVAAGLLATSFGVAYGTNEQGLNQTFYSADLAANGRLPYASAAVRRLPSCVQAHVEETLIVPHPVTSTKIWHFALDFHNTGAACKVDALWSFPAGVKGASHTSIYGLWGNSPYIPASKLPWIELRGHAVTSMPFDVLSPWSPTYVARQRLDVQHPHLCSSVLADGFVEDALNTGWRPAYFALPYTVPICSVGLYNVWGSLYTPAKK